MTGYILQNSPQDSEGFETFFELCLKGLKEDPQCWVFLRGDGVYQGLNGQRIDEPGFTVPVAGGWNALLARGVQIFVNGRCARLRGLGKESYFLNEAKLTDLKMLAKLCLTADNLVVI